jgi:ParB family transcriptional regulator, chromosome partitioning protein
MMKSVENEATWTKIDIDSIDEADTFYRISTSGGEEPLRQSISEIGLLHPPLVIQQKPGFYQIVSGFKRILACRALNVTSIPVMEFPSDFSPVRLAVSAISDNSLSRNLNPIETARALVLLQNVTSGPVSFQELAIKTGLPSYAGVIPKHSLLLELPPEVQQGIISGDITIAIANELSRFDSDLVTCFYSLFSILKLSLNKQREVITLCEEIAIREDIPILSLLSEPGISEILKNPDIDRNQKSRALRLYLRKRRFPSIHKTECRYFEAAKRLKLGEGMLLQPPKDFEGTSYTLCLKFDTAEQLSHQINELEHIKLDPALKMLLKASEL